MKNHDDGGSTVDRAAKRGPGSRTRIRSVQKASSILLLLGSGPASLRAREVAERLGMPVATTYHLLETLVGTGLLAKDAGKAYYLGPAVGVLADAFRRQLAAPGTLLVPLHQLADSTGETVYLSRWQDGDAVVLATIEGRHELRVSGLHSGTRGHAHARAAGKLFLAFASPEERERYFATHPLVARTRATITDRAALDEELQRIRAQGFALDREEFADGIISVSAPLLRDGVVIAAYTAAVPTSRFIEQRDGLIGAVRAAASGTHVPANP